MRAGIVRRPDPTTVQRYRIVQTLGRGGMGVVYEAYDDELSRRLAIKLVRGDRADPVRQLRMRREAEAMARLSHPNVVQVYDVGSTDGQTFIAMELVDGVTLRQWQAARTRSHEEILTVYGAAGRGLFAAHRAGLVHRDFKPDNVLVGNAGEVKVGDFGLARRDDVEGGARAVGTAGYMAPEQRHGKSDARSDQYSFCFALREALEGSGRGSPHVRAALERGLSESPDQRFASMDELLRAVGRTPPKTGRRAWAALAFAGGAMVVAAASSSESEQCSAAAIVEDSWTPERADAIENAFRSTRLPFAPHAADRVGSELDAYAAQWHEQYRRVCEAKTPEHQRAAGCLEQRAREMAALIDLLADPSTPAVQQGVSATQGLARPRSCVEPDVAVAVASPVLLRDLAALRAVDLAARGRDSLASAEDVVRRAEASGAALVAAEARFLRGRFLERAGEYPRARAHFEQAYHEAQAAGDDGLAARAATMLVTVVGSRQLDHDAALDWARHGMTALDRNDSPIVRASLLVARGAVHITVGDYEQAELDFRTALDRLRAELGEDEFAVAATLNNLASVHARLGRYDEAEAELLRSREVFSRVLGPEHPHVGSTLANLAAVQIDRGNHRQAVETLREATTRLASSLGADHPLVSTTESNLGLALIELGEPESALEHLDHVVQVRTENLRAGHPQIAYALVNRGQARLALGDFDGAERDFRDANDIMMTALGQHHPLVDAVATGLDEAARRHGGA